MSIIKPEFSSVQEIKVREGFYKLFKNCPIPENEMLQNLHLFMNRQILSRVIFLHELYKKIINVHGVIMDLGTRWGGGMVLFQSFRGMYEPFNFNRKIIGFDTFTGLHNIDEKDGKADIVKEGEFSTTENYKEYLEKILDYHEQESPLSHIKKYELVEGDVCSTIDEYIKDNPETIVALAYFDFDIYQPTKKGLEAIKDRLTKGSIVAFDELNWPKYPGETLAVKEVFGLNNYPIKRSPLNPGIAYITI